MRSGFVAWAIPDSVLDGIIAAEYGPLIPGRCIGLLLGPRESTTTQSTGDPRRVQGATPPAIPTSGPAASLQFRTSFIDSSRKSCLKTATARAPSMAAEKIDAYCRCFSTGAADLLTKDDVSYMLDHVGNMPANSEQRLQPVVECCRGDTLSSRSLLGSA
jgi:hypothetical protein